MKNLRTDELHAIRLPYDVVGFACLYLYFQYITTFL